MKINLAVHWMLLYYGIWCAAKFHETFYILYLNIMSMFYRILYTKIRQIGLIFIMDSENGYFCDESIVNGVVQHNSGCISDMKKGLLATH